jgi:hypothetical protein
MRLFRHGADPNTPKKAATNAIEAERAKSARDLGELLEWGKIAGSFLLGAIVAEYFGGGGGSVPDVSLMIMQLI